MPSNYTQHYKLNQWEPEDRVLRADFNADNAKIDGAISTVEKKADALAVSKADQAALEAEIKARTSALATVNTALSRCGNCRIETFTYVGTTPYRPVDIGDDTHSIRFSAKPAFFVVAGSDVIILGGGPGRPVACVFNVDGRSGNGVLKVTWSGTTITIDGDQRTVGNQKGVVYQVTAFYAKDAT